MRAPVTGREDGGHVTRPDPAGQQRPVPALCRGGGPVQRIGNAARQVQNLSSDRTAATWFFKRSGPAAAALGDDERPDGTD